ncbi:MAG: Wzt carbohydrate-binding domain-containing protein, partial [Kiritimatiellae bacterium]|nr:Wzt carbohydrate-binding domain-containing protein [Kiritimatiellia bacterium]
TGAGKSTLFKSLTRTTEPTPGKATIRGRVGSLLEVGTGFHPELTGRENVFMNGTILGMRKREVALKFDEIVAFSGIEKFIDTPVKRYSSGMYVRLAFAVAAHLDPEIMIVDEVLAVGDAEFQKRCLGKMSQVAKEGRTVLFVSHQMSAVSELCDRSILMQKGSVHAEGPTDELIKGYLESNTDHASFYRANPEEKLDQQGYIAQAMVLDANQERRSKFDYKEGVSVEIRLELREIPIGTVVGASLKDAMDRRLFTTQHPLSEEERRAGRVSFLVRLPEKLLAPGGFSFQIALHLPRVKMYDYLHSVCHFEIVDTGSEFSYSKDDYGSFLVDCAWRNLSE